MSTNNWWANKLAGNQPPAQSRPSTPPVAPPPAARIPQVPSHAPGNPQQNIAVNAENIMEAAALWQGGQATRTETQNCPSCNSHLYFSNQNSKPGASGRCFSCGYSQAFPQSQGPQG